MLNEEMRRLKSEDLKFLYERVNRIKKNQFDKMREKQLK
jgi:hypothetical protein